MGSEACLDKAVRLAQHMRTQKGKALHRVRVLAAAPLGLPLL